MGKRLFIGLAVVGGLGLAAAAVLKDSEQGGRRGGQGPAPVEVSAVENGPIRVQRTFAGSLEARSRVSVAANVAGRVRKVHVDLSDPVEQGQIVAELDDAEEAQGVVEASADQGVARANMADAKSALEIAKRELARLEALEKSGVVSQAELDVARASYLAKETGVKVAESTLRRQTAGLARSRIRSGYTSVVATWSGDGGPRVVAERHVDEGDRVSAGDPLITVVTLDPVNAVVYVTEREYGRLEPGQAAQIGTDAFPNASFDGVIQRIAPVFSDSSRQARVEVQIANPDGKLKPGMFVRVSVVLDRVDEAVIVPVDAISTRGGQSGVFVVDDAGKTVAWRPVELGVRDGDRVQVIGDGVAGRVVTLGHQLVDDGSAIVIPEARSKSAEVAKDDAVE